MLSSFREEYNNGVFIVEYSSIYFQVSFTNVEQLLNGEVYRQYVHKKRS